MSNTSSHHDKNQKNTSSGQGALGMGGDPSDDPRDLAGGGDGRSIDDDTTGKQPVAGAFGSAEGATADAQAAASQAVGPAGGPGAADDVAAALNRSKPIDPA